MEVPVNHIGKLCLPIPETDEKLREFRSVYSLVVPVDVYLSDDGNFHVTALSNYFRPVEAGQPIPVYHVEFTANGVKFKELENA